MNSATTRLTGARRRTLRLAVVGAMVLGALQLSSSPAVGVPVCNTTPIVVEIPSEPTGGIRRANPYPSTINITATGTITDVDVSLNGLAHPFPEDLDFLLVAPDGSTRLLLASDVGGNDGPSNAVTGVNLTLSDEAAAPLPADSILTSGTFRPTDDDDDPDDGPTDTFLAPAPTPGTATTLSVFDGLPATGTWSLYVVDDSPGPPTPAMQGLLNGWCLDITTSASPSTTAPPTTSTSTSTSTSSTLPATTTSTVPATTSTVPATTSTVPVPTSSTSTTMAPATACSAPPPATIFAQPGVTTFGTEGDDVIYGTPGNDRILGQGGNDIILGFGGDDQLAGGNGNDLLCGGDGNDQLSGDAGNDLLVGEAGNDSISGAAGDDRLIGGTGVDRLSAGSGIDTCNAGGQQGDASAPPPDCDTIT